jgi:hypothetical protein
MNTCYALEVVYCIYIARQTCEALADPVLSRWFRRSFVVYAIGFAGWLLDRNACRAPLPGGLWSDDGAVGF